MTQNPLARSRLESVKGHIERQTSNDGWLMDCLNPKQIETIAAALQHLLSPTVTDDMKEVAQEAWRFGTGPLSEDFGLALSAMITQLTKEDQ